MNLQKIVTLVTQFIFSWIIGTVSFIAVPIGNGWELVSLPIFFSIGVCAAGWLVARLFKNPISLTPTIFLWTLLFSGLGSAILMIPRAWGLQGLLLPILGAMAGYHLMLARMG